MKFFLEALTRARTIRTALKVSLLVGTVLNLANRSGLTSADGGISWLHIFINYLVPYCVSSYSAARNEIGNAIKQPGIVE